MCLVIIEQCSSKMSFFWQEIIEWDLSAELALGQVRFPSYFPFLWGVCMSVQRCNWGLKHHRGRTSGLMNAAVQVGVGIW